MRILCFVILGALCAPVLKAQVTASDLLEGEPEWIKVKNVRPAPYSTNGYRTSIIASAAQNYGRYGGVRMLVQQLNERLLDDLLVCSGQCKNQDAKEDEYWLLQHQLPSYEFTPRRNRLDTVVDERWGEKDPDFRTRSMLDERCLQISGIKDGEQSGYYDQALGHSVPQSPEKIQKYSGCRAELLAIGIKHTGIDPTGDGGLWKTHVAIWKYCAAMYRVEKTDFQQPAYSACMNRYDVETIIRTKYRLSHGRHGEDMGPLPSDKDLALLAKVPPTFKP